MIIALMMEAVWASETSVNSYQSTRRFNPEDSHLLMKILTVHVFPASCYFMPRTSNYDFA
jgi:hypothetical protein